MPYEGRNRQYLYKKIIRRLSEIEKNVEEIGREREKMRKREKNKTGQTKAKGLH
jgi:hypothetical protein